MRHVNCPQEAAVTQALRAGNLETSLATHARACAVCRDIVRAASWMQALARESGGSPDLPDASLVWWKAQLSERRMKVEKAQDIVEWVEIASTAGVSLGLAAYVAANWYAIEEWLTGILSSAQLWVTAYSTSTLFLPVAAVLSLAALAVVYPIIMDV